MDEDRRLYEDFLDGSESAFEEIMARHRLSLIYFCNHYLKDLHGAEDIAIDVFTYLLVHPKRYNFKTELKTYLFMLARSRAIDELRRRSRWQFSDSSPEEEVSTAIHDLEEQVLTKEIQQKVRAAVSSLPEEMQLAVHLIYFESLSYKEAALVMKKSPKQVDNLLYRAKEKLRKELGKEGEALL